MKATSSAKNDSEARPNDEQADAVLRDGRTRHSSGNTPGHDSRHVCSVDPALIDDAEIIESLFYGEKGLATRCSEQM